MDESEQALAYANADFSEPNQRFVELFAAQFPDLRHGAVVDLGCGPGDIVIRLARRCPGLTVHGIDGARAMLAHGEARLAALPELRGRVQFVEGVLPGARLPRASYDVVTSNSLLHHLHDPQVLWQSIQAVAAPGAAVLVMDLYRPESTDAAWAIVEKYSGGEPDVLKCDFFHSLCAAFTPGEVETQLRTAGLGGLSVKTVSDRHLVVSGQLPA